MFTTIVITLPQFLPDEAERIAALLDEGRADLVHIRKPESARVEVESLLRAIPVRLHTRLTLHDYFELTETFRLHGVHTNSRHPSPPDGFKGSVSHSCHSLDEAARLKEQYDFVSLSPIFDSISKRGYRSAFSSDEIIRAAKAGIIDSKVYALGGVTFGRIPLVKEMGFGGAMLLGDAWK